MSRTTNSLNGRERSSDHLFVGRREQRYSRSANQEEKTGIRYAEDDERKLARLALELETLEEKFILESERRHQLEEELRVHRESHTKLLNAIQDLVLRLDQFGNVKEVNLPEDWVHCYPLFGGNNLGSILPKRIVKPLIAAVRKAISTGQDQAVEFKHFFNRKRRYWQVRLVPCSDGEDVWAVARDLTDQARLEKEILDIRERECERIGQDLHDDLGQLLSGIKFLCTVVTQKALRKELVEPEETSYIEGLVNGALVKLRSIARGLHNPSLEHKSLAESLQELARQSSTIGITCVFECASDHPAVPQPAVKDLYHIAQEAVNNAFKHARGNRISIQLSEARDEFILKVSDNGKGMSNFSESNDGMGLLIMRRRARRIGATIDFVPSEKGGVTVICKMPKWTQDKKGGCA